MNEKNRFLQLCTYTFTALLALFGASRLTPAVHASEAAEASWDITGEGHFTYSVAAFCANQNCSYGGGGYVCQASANPEYCSNYASSCGNTVCK